MAITREEQLQAEINRQIDIRKRANDALNRGQNVIDVSGNNDWADAAGTAYESQIKEAQLRRELEPIVKRNSEAAGQIVSGMETGQRLLPEGSLGRAKAQTQIDTALGRMSNQQLDVNAIREGRSLEVADIIARRKEQLQGFTNEELQASRAIANQRINRETQGAVRQLKSSQAASGLRGGTAVSQQAQLLQQGVKTKAEFERDLFLQNAQMKREALSNYESAVNAAEKFETERDFARAELKKFNLVQSKASEEFNLAQQLRERQLQQSNLQAAAEQERFNLQQAANEKMGQLSVALGQSQLVSSDIQSERAAEAQRASAAAQSSGGK